MTDNPVARWNAHNPQQTYHYIGKDGKSVLARVLEDQRDAALARIAELEAARDAAHAAGYAEAINEFAAIAEAQFEKAKSAYDQFDRPYDQGRADMANDLRWAIALNSEAKP
jgi:exosome complex RNA-binding protein Csl4